VGREGSDSNIPLERWEVKGEGGPWAVADWTVAIGVLIVAVLFIQIFIDYRKKLTMLMPSATEVSSRKQQMNVQIAESEGSLNAVRATIEQLKKDIDRLEERRIELQTTLNPLEMIEIPDGKCRIGTGTPGRPDENPEHLVSISRFYIDKYEVTNLQYKEFIEATAHRAPTHWRNRTFPDARKGQSPGCQRLMGRRQRLRSVDRQAPADRGRMGACCPRRGA
jgi:formylglycine-generating enzyme required for sulfatase activity